MGAAAAALATLVLVCPPAPTWSMSTRTVSMEGSRTLLSAALTRISSKILYRPGAYVTARNARRSPSCTQSVCCCFSVLPM